MNSQLQSNCPSKTRVCFFFNFSTKLAVLSNSLPQKKALALPSLTSQPHQVLASDLVPYSDVQQVTMISWYIFPALVLLIFICDFVVGYSFADSALHV